MASIEEDLGLLNHSSNANMMDTHDVQELQEDSAGLRTPQCLDELFPDMKALYEDLTVLPRKGKTSSNSAQIPHPGQSAKHNLPKFLVRNIKKLIKTYLKQEDAKAVSIGTLYLQFAYNEMKESLKSLNSFWFRPAQSKRSDKAAYELDAQFIQFIREQGMEEQLEQSLDVLLGEAVKDCQSFFKGFILANKGEIVHQGQKRGFSKEERKGELTEYARRFVASVEEGVPRGKDVKRDQ